MTDIHIGDIIQAIVYFIPIATLIWKMSALNSQVGRNTKDIEGLGNKMRSTVDDYKNIIKEMADKIDNINKSMAKIEAVIEYMQKNGKGTV